MSDGMWHDNYWIEAQDRCATISTMIVELLEGHPGIERTPKGRDMMEKSVAAVQKLYHAVSKAEHDAGVDVLAKDLSEEFGCATKEAIKRLDDACC